MSSISYNGRKLIPCPILSISKTYSRTEDECEKLCPEFEIQLNGTICIGKGSPTESGTFWTTSGSPPDTPAYSVDNALNYALRKQEAIRGLFSQDGLWFEIQPWDNTTPTKFRPIVNSINFEEGQWVDRVDYTINLTTHQIFGPLFPSGEDSITPCIENANETWNLEINEDANNTILTNTYRLSHEINAKGKCHYDEDGNHYPPWKHARDYVFRRAGVDFEFVTQSGAFDIPSFYGVYNHIRSTSIDELGGTYQLSENWIVSSGDCVEDFSVESRESLDDGTTKVSIQGEVRGLETRGTRPSGLGGIPNDAYSTIIRHKYTAASSCFQTIVEPLIFTRAQLYSGKTLNPLHSTKVVTRNPIGGVIQYNIEYDNRPSNCISGSKIENINVQDSFPVDIYAKHQILCRDAGTLFQPSYTRTHYGRSLNADVVMSPSSGCTVDAILNGTRPDWTELIDKVKPTVPIYYTNEHNETWNPKTGNGSLSISWEWPSGQ